MKRSITAAAVLAAALAMTATACSSSKKSSENPPTSSGGGSSSSAPAGAGKTITVWLMTDAQKGWPDVVTQATQRFEQATGAKVNLQWQNWNNFTTKLDSTFAGSTGIPDVVELGNTQTASYIAAGAFKQLDKSKFENSDTWLKGLEDSGTSADGKLMAVPYYAGSRIVIYRKDQFQQAGITTTPKTLSELYADADKLKAKFGSDKKFSAFYMPGQYWYAAMSFVYGAGGEIASQQDGKWQGSLESSEAQKGLANWQKLASQYSVGGTTKNEADQDGIMAQGHTGMILGNGWEVGSVIDPKTGNPGLKTKLGTFPLPGESTDHYTPSFLGGSDLAVPAKASNSDLGAEWIKYFTDTQSQTALAKFAIPNTTSLLSTYEAVDSVADANKATGEAAKDTWFVPQTPNWANVEANNILQNGLEDIATGKKSIADAAKSMDQKISDTLNAS